MFYVNKAKPIFLCQLMVHNLNICGFPINRDHCPPLVIGHRGAAGHAPENTLEALEKANELGVKWVEFDVKLTRDDIPILFHDDALERTTEGQGNISDYNLSELQSLDAGSWFAPQYCNLTIPTLHDAMSLLTKLHMGANIELKPSPNREARTGMVVGTLLQRTWPDVLPAPLISSFSPEALEAFASVAPLFTRALLYLDIPGNWRTQLDHLKIRTLHCLSRRLRRSRAKEILSSGYIVRCYTVNNVDRARQLLDWGVNGVISDYPDRIIEQL